MAINNTTGASSSTTSDTPSSGERSRVVQTQAPVRIMIANSKGGCGKTTVATNLASFLSKSGQQTAIIDYDPQHSSIDWLKERDEQHPNIHGVSVAQRTNPTAMTRSWSLRVPAGTSRVILDTPAGLAGNELSDLVQHADIILIPVIPSSIDIRAVTYFIKDILLSYSYRMKPKPIAVVANRVRKNTIIYGKLERFLATLSIPFIAALRDTQYYVHASEQGLGLADLANVPRKDKKEWEKLTRWIDEQAMKKEGRL